MQIRAWFFRVALFGIALVTGGMVQAQQDANFADFFYFSKGDTPDNWQWVLSDPGNWWMPLAGNQGVTEGGKLAMEPSDDKRFPKAVKLTWAKSDQFGGAKITGRTLDLSKYEHNGQLMLALKVTAKTKKSVEVKMECGDKCEGKVVIQDFLKKAKMNEWFALPIPLDCFVQQGANLKNVTSPFSIGTNGKMVVYIAEISLQAMAEGDEGCMPNDGDVEK